MSSHWYGTEGTCDTCGASFKKKRTEDQRYCSRKCFAHTRRCPERPCPQCGATFAGRDDRQFCSRQCVTAYKRAQAAATVSDGQKPCTKCTVRKPFSEFSPHSLGLGGVRSICKRCSSDYELSQAKTPSGRARRKRASANHRRSPGGAARRVAWNRDWAVANPERYMLNRARSRAKKYGLPCTITEADIVIPERCPVLGIPLIIAQKQFREPEGGGRFNSMSLDRIDSTRGYEPGNVAVISWRANTIKNNATLEELDALVSWMRSVTRPVSAVPAETAPESTHRSADEHVARRLVPDPPARE